MTSRARAGFPTAICLALAAFIAAPGSAAAATTVGQTFAATQTCGAGYTFAQTAVSGGQPSYTVPAGGGILTSWSYQATDGPEQLKFKAVKSDGAQWVVVGESPLETMAPGRINSFPISIPVQGGEIIGFYNATGTSKCSNPTGGNTEIYAFGDQPPGTPFSATSQAGELLNVSARLEPDADKDGFGDETQDGCPSKSSVHGACVLGAPSISGVTEVGKALTANAGPAQGGTPTYQWLRGKGTTFTPIPGATGNTYTLGKSDRGKQIEVTESVSHPNGSDSATSSPTGVIGPPLLKASVKKTQRVVKQRGVVVKLRSNLAGTVTATWTIALPKGIAKTLRFKRVKRSLTANKTRKLKLTLSKKSFASLKRALAAKNKQKAKLTLVVKDKKGGRSTKKLRVTLKR